MSALRALALLLLPAIVAGQTLASSAPPAAPAPAEWKSYDVLVEFRTLPRTYPLRAGATQYAETTVSEQAVRFAPGAPSSLQAADCELMRQMEETLLAGLPVDITASAFDCTAAAKSFTLTLNAPLVANEGAAPRS
jgi:hypothetical protein